MLRRPAAADRLGATVRRICLGRITMVGKRSMRLAPTDVGAAGLADWSVPLLGVREFTKWISGCRGF